MRQKPFEGSRRQKRAEVVRLLLAAREDGACGLTAAEVTAELDAFEAKAGRGPVERGLVEELLAKLAQEGFCVAQDGRWSSPSVCRSHTAREPGTFRAGASAPAMPGA